MTSLRLFQAYFQGSTSFSKGGLKELKRQDRLWVLPVALLGIIVGGASFMGLLVTNYRALFSLGLSSGNPELVIFTALMAAWLIQFIMGIPMVLSVLFFGKDNTLLMTLPVRPLDVVLSKALYLVSILLPLQLFLFVPGVVVYLQGMAELQAGGAAATAALEAAMGSVAAAEAVLNPGLLFWVSTIIYSLAGTLVPLALSMLVISLLIRIVNVSRYKTAVELVGLILTLVAIVGLQLLLTRTMTASGGEVMDPQALSSIAQVLTGSLYAALPPISWAAQGFSQVLPFLGGLAFVAAFSAAGLYLVQALYLRSLSKHREGGGGRRVQELPAAQTGTEEAGTTKISPAGSDILSPRSPIAALVHREWKVLSSQSTFLFESMAQVVIFPLMLLILGVTMPEDFLSMISQAGLSPALLDIIIFGAIVLMLCLNSVAPTSLSREGKLFALNTLLPSTASQQVIAKLLFHFILFLPALILDLVIAIFVIGFQPISLLWALPAGIGFVVLFFALGLSLDLRRPLLNWSHPQQAMKQNMNVLLAMGLDVLILGGFVAAVFGLTQAGLSWGGIGWILMLLALILGVLGLQWVRRSAKGRYEDEIAS